MDVERNVKQASTDVDAFLATGQYVHDYDESHVKVDAPKATRKDFIRHFGQWHNGKVLLGTAYSWLVLNSFVGTLFVGFFTVGWALTGSHWTLPSTVSV